jgi:hypothetical protein
MTPGAVTATPDPRRSLTDGILVQASVLARVLGVRLLTLDTTVVLMPADIQVSSPVGHDGPGSAWGRRQTARTTARPARAAPTRAGAGRHGLADAVRSINEGAAALAMTRDDGAT